MFIVTRDCCKYHHKSYKLSDNRYFSLFLSLIDLCATKNKKVVIWQTLKKSQSKSDHVLTVHYVLIELNLKILKISPIGGIMAVFSFLRVKYRNVSQTMLYRPIVVFLKFVTSGCANPPPPPHLRPLRGPRQPLMFHRRLRLRYTLWSFRGCHPPSLRPAKSR